MKKKTKKARPLGIPLWVYKASGFGVQKGLVFGFSDIVFGFARVEGLWLKF